MAPGATDRFIGMAENQGRHRQRMEWRFLNYNGIAQILGVVFAGIAVLMALAGGIYLLAQDKKLEGFGTIITAVGTVATIFVTQRRSQNEEKAQKRQAPRR